MKISNLLRHIAIATSALLLAACSTPGTRIGQDNAAAANARTVKFQQIRNATIKVEYAGTTFLVDPMLAKKGAYPGFEGTYNSHLRYPLVELPLPVSEVMKADAIIVTHTHADHWDDAARQGLPKNLPIFAQDEEDAESIRKDGFTDVRVLTEDTVFNGTRLSKTGGQHGDDKVMTEPVGKLLGTGKEDLSRASQAAPKATVIGSHMESVNHATQSRKELRDYIAEKGLDPRRVLVPEDGQAYSF